MAFFMLLLVYGLFYQTLAVLDGSLTRRIERAAAAADATHNAASSSRDVPSNSGNQPRTNLRRRLADAFHDIHLDPTY